MTTFMFINQKKMRDLIKIVVLFLFLPNLSLGLKFSDGKQVSEKKVLGSLTKNFNLYKKN